MAALCQRTASSEFGGESFAGHMTASEVVPVANDEDGVRGGRGQEPGGNGVLVLAAGGAECAEGGGVGAAFGGEVAAEAEHVRPGGQAEAVEFGDLAEAEAFGDETASVI